MMLALLLVLAAPPNATLPDTTPWTVDAVVAAARENNPRLTAARHRATAATHLAAAAAPWPEPELMLEGNPMPALGGPWAMASLTQPIPWPAMLEGERDAAAAETRAMTDELRMARLAVEAEARAAFHRLHLARAEATINDDVLAITRRLLRITEDRLAVDRAAITDVLQAQVEVARQETAALDLAARITTREAELNALLARDVFAPVPSLVVPAPDDRARQRTEALLALAREGHPAITRHTAALEAARARLRAAETRGRPMFAAGIGYGIMSADARHDSGAMMADGPMLILGVELPIWGRAAADAERAAAAATIDAATADRRAATDLQAARVVEQAIAVETALRAVHLYRDTALPLAEETLTTLEAAYAAGQADFDRVLAAEQMRERYAIDAARAATAFELRLAALAEAVGQPIEPVASDAPEKAL